MRWLVLFPKGAYEQKYNVLHFRNCHDRAFYLRAIEIKRPGCSGSVISLVLFVFYFIVPAPPAFSQTLSDFRDAVLAPLAIHGIETNAIDRRKTLTSICLEAQAGRPKDLLDFAASFHPVATGLNTLRDLDKLTPEQATAMCGTALIALDANTRSRLAVSLSDLTLKTTSAVTDQGLLFTVCEEKVGRQWKPGPGGTFQRLQVDSPC
jgi:hypothetical protein